MQKDILKDIIDKVENWCSQNRVSIFYGEIDDNKTTEVKWIQKDNSDWEKYVSVLKNVESKILAVTIYKNEFDNTNEKIFNYLETLDDDGKKDYNSALDTIKKTKGQITSFVLTFFSSNVCYQYEQFSDWFGEYQTVYEAYDFNDEDDDDINHDRLTDDKIEEAARKVITDKKYLEAKNRFERIRIAETLTERDGIEDYHDRMRIARKAEDIFDDEIKLQQETELTKKILELKAKGLIKKAICSKLKITQGLLDKYYYQDDD